MSDHKKLRAFRMNLRLSQKELANLLGLHSWIPAWEGGSFPPPPYIWRALAKLKIERQGEKPSSATRRSPKSRRRKNARLAN